MTVPARSLKYRPELDGMRCVAVLLVIVHHVWQPHRFAGFVGVDMFFVLSGYLITTILLNEVARTGSLRFGRFYLRRILRLYPALLGMLIVTFPLYSLITQHSSLLVQAKRSIVAATYTSNVYMTYRHGWLGPETHTWSLAMEEQYYLVWPVVLLILIRIGLRGRGMVGLLGAGALTAAVLSVREFSFGASSYPLQSTSLGLMSGSMLAVLLLHSAQARAALARRSVGGAGVALLTALLVLFSLTTAVPDGAYVVASVLATAFLIGHTTGSSRSVLVRLLSIRPVVSLGRVSYGIYLWHYPLVLLAARWLPHWSPWLRLLVVAPSAIAVAYLSYAYLELPFLRMKNRIGRGVDSAGPAAQMRGERAAGDLVGPGDRHVSAMSRPSDERRTPAG